MMNRRRLLAISGAAAAVSVLGAKSYAESYPSRPIRLIVGFPPGGGTDAVARLVAQSLSQRLNQQVIVENRPGAGTNLATEAAVKAPPDGYTLLLVGSPQAINATLYDKLSFDLARDIEPVAGVARGTYVMATNPSLPTRTVPELIAYARANPSKINMASSGIGTPPHVAGELFKSMTRTDMLHVPYRGDAPALTDLLGGRVHLYFSSLGGAIEHIKADKLRALAVTSSTRSSILPDVPTVGDFVPGYEASSFWGIGAPKTTPTSIVERLSKDIIASLADPDVNIKFSQLGATTFARSPADFGSFVAEEISKWGKVVKSAAIRPE